MHLDLKPIVETSVSFYHSHGLQSWGDAFTRQARLAPQDAVRIEWAERAGWEEVFIFPPFALQVSDLDHLVNVTARRHAPGLPDDQQYTEEPFLADLWTKKANGRIAQRRFNLGCREAGAYLFVYSRNPVPSAWGRSGGQIVELIEAKGWQGLTVPEYLVLQRYLCEREGNHRFFLSDAEPRGHHLWLVDSATEAQMAIASSNQRGINLQACPLSHRDAKRATIAGMALALVTS